MPLSARTEAPLFLTEEEDSARQATTPSTFADQASVLRLQLDGVQCLLQPQQAWPDDAGAAQASNASSNGSSSNTPRNGRLWVTEGSLSFLSDAGTGFSLDYPSLSLHAVSRTLPPTLREQASTLPPAKQGCIYCQLDLSSEDDDDESEEDEGRTAELWIVPTAEDEVELLFETLSRCASLHPTAGGGEDDDGGHPFASIGPFGTGLQKGDGHHDRLQVEGAFDDADEDGGGELSETGRATLTRLDALLQWSDEGGDSGPRFASVCKNNNATTALATVTSVAPSNALILVHLPDELFNHPPLAAALLDLLHAYGALQSWTPLPGLGRAIVVYEETEGAQRAKEALDRLLLPLMDEDEEEGSYDETPQKRQADDHEGLALRAYYGDSSALTRMVDERGEHLLVPTTDRNFLISPPGSPPVGWEPIREDPPNTNTLADDLIAALGSLRDRGLGVRGHTPDVLSSTGHQRSASSASATSLMPPPSLIIPPRQAPSRSLHPCALEASAAEGEEDAANGMVSLPGVVVQSFDPVSDDEDDALDTRMNKGLSITSVKATVESMRGSSGTLGSAPASEASKITPTSRPPLGR